jgi:hypothetical protein
MVPNRTTARVTDFLRFLILFSVAKFRVDSNLRVNHFRVGSASLEFTTNYSDPFFKRYMVG